MSWRPCCRSSKAKPVSSRARWLCYSATLGLAARVRAQADGRSVLRFRLGRIVAFQAQSGAALWTHANAVRYSGFFGSRRTSSSRLFGHRRAPSPAPSAGREPREHLRQLQFCLELPEASRPWPVGSRQSGEGIEPSMQQLDGPLFEPISEVIAASR